MPGKANTSITIDADILKAAKKLAKSERRSFSSYVEHSLYLRIAEAHRLERASAKASRKA
jgi:hypothetical protein